MTAETRTTVPVALPVADRDVDADEVERLRMTLLPEPGVTLAHVAWSPSPMLIGEGWDNTIWDVGSLADGTALALRVARRTSAIELLDREVHVLRALAAAPDELPMRVPTILASRRAAVLQPWFPGRMAALGGPAELQRIAPYLARMLARLHRPAPEGLTRSALRGVPLARIDARVRADVERIELPRRLEERVLAVWDEGLAAPLWNGPAVLLHGDPHPGNVVLADDRGLPALIDFGDTTAGDPAGDIGGLLLYRGGDEVLEEYFGRCCWDGHDDPAVRRATVARGRAWSVRYAIALLTAYPLGSPYGDIADAHLRFL